MTTTTVTTALDGHTQEAQLDELVGKLATQYGEQRTAEVRQVVAAERARFAGATVHASCRSSSNGPYAPGLTKHDAIIPLQWRRCCAMDLAPYVDHLRTQLAVAAEAGGDESRALAERLTSPLESAVRLNALSAAVPDQLPAGSSIEHDSATGDVRTDGLLGACRFHTAHGDILVERADSSVTAKTAYGSVRLQDVVRGSVVLETSAGELEVGVREGTSAWLDVNTVVGSVRSSLSASNAPVASDETVEVRARTYTGDIVIHRS